MTRARPSLLLPLLAIVALAIAACQTERKPITGFDSQPPGTLDLDGDEQSMVMLWPIFDLPLEPHETFRIRLNGQAVVYNTTNEGYYDYAKIYLQGWTGGYDQSIRWVPSGTYTVEMVDSAGQSYGQSAPLAISAGGIGPNQTFQSPAVVFTHYDGQADSWIIDPTLQDGDPATDEITLTNLLGEGVVVERCLIAATVRSSCTPVGTIAPGADLRTVETVVPPSMGDHQALFIHLASDASQSYQRDLVQGSVGVVFSPGGSCQMERIIVHGMHPMPAFNPSGLSSFAMSSCYGYGSGEP